MAYTVAALSHESACRVAYFRGKLTGYLAHQLGVIGISGDMLSANLREDEVPKYLETFGFGTSNEASVFLACINSPKNVTLAGPANLINAVKTDLDQKAIFAQKLNTGVAYHSPAMRVIGNDYATSIGSLKKGPTQDPITIVSSVTGQIIEPEVLATPQYWVDNLVSPVRFAKALNRLTNLTTKTNSGVPRSAAEACVLTDLVEIGPHTALRRPVKETAPQLRYHAWIQRSVSPLLSTLQLVGSLFSLGYPTSIIAANGQDQGKNPYLVDCPPYPFDHSRRYWDESRISRDWRLREPSPGFLLGRRTHDWNPLKPRWRNRLCVETIPWLGEHHVSAYIMHKLPLIAPPSHFVFLKTYVVPPVSSPLSPAFVQCRAPNLTIMS